MLVVLVLTFIVHHLHVHWLVFIFILMLFEFTYTEWNVDHLFRSFPLSIFTRIHQDTLTVALEEENECVFNGSPPGRRVVVALKTAGEAVTCRLLIVNGLTQQT